MTETYTFPKLVKYVKETPLWLCLEYYGYEQYFDNRKNATLGDPTKRFWLPLPSHIGSACSIRASDKAQTLATTRAGYLPTDYPVFGGSTTAPTSVAPPPPDTTGRYPIFPGVAGGEITVTNEGTMRQSSFNYGMFGALGDGTTTRQIPLSLGMLATEGKNNEGYVDIVDTAWYGSNKKSYRFTLNLTAKSIECSEEARIICNELTNLILPAWGTASSTSGALYNRSTIHPGVWQPRVISGVGNETADLADATKEWLGNYPQPCLLLEANAFRQGSSETSITAMLKSNSTNLYPINYFIDLSLQEIEPSYVAKVEDTETTVSSRSKLLEAYSD